MHKDDSTTTLSTHFTCGYVSQHWDGLYGYTLVNGGPMFTECLSESVPQCLTRDKANWLYPGKKFCSSPVNSNTYASAEPKPSYEVSFHQSLAGGLTKVRADLQAAMKLKKHMCYMSMKRRLPSSLPFIPPSLLPSFSTE